MTDGRSAFLVFLAAILWGTTGTAQTFAPDSATPVVIGAVRLAIGGPALLISAFLKRKLNHQGWSVIPVIMAALCIAAYQPLFFSAVKLTGVAIGTVTAIGSAPILAGILEWIVKRKIPERNWWLATFLAMMGCLLLIRNDHEMNAAPLGIIMAIGAGLSFAAYTLITKHLLEKHTPEAAVGVVFTLSSIFLTPFLFVYNLKWLLDLHGIAVALYLGLFATALSYMFFAKGLMGIHASTAVTLSLAEPLTAALLGVFIVGETLAPIAWTGVLLLFIGLGLLSFKPGKQKRR
ncbi:EamA family transporter [Bacillus smithii]|uniref:EamA family transporter n=1 Tax=Bacillus smithii TaxID=1479 RepID=UPI002E221BA1|nr:EamA family transporter [Bacillus smithii]MED1454722.1 EamA family transporter [Bacillus smithii]